MKKITVTVYLSSLFIICSGRSSAYGEKLEPLLKIEKKGFSSSLGLLVKFWFVPYAGKDCWYGDPVFRPGVDIHRTTLMFMGLTPFNLDFKADLTLGIIHEHEADFEAVELGFKITPALKIIGGYSHHAPFTAVATTDHEYLLFNERPLGIEFMIPRGQPGLMFQSNLKNILHATVGLFKQSQWEQDFLYAARFLITAGGNPPKARWGFSSNEPGYGKPVLSVGGSVMSYRGDMGLITGLAAEFSFYYKFLSIASELIYFNHKTSLKQNAEVLYDTFTVYGQIGVFIWKDTLLLGTRYQWYDGALSTQRKVKRHRITGGIYGFFAGGRLRLSFEYIQQIDELFPVNQDETKGGAENEIALFEVRIFL